MTTKELKEATEKSQELMHRICIGEYELSSMKQKFMELMDSIKQHFADEFNENLKKSENNGEKN